MRNIGGFAELALVGFWLMALGPQGQHAQAQIPPQNPPTQGPITKGNGQVQATTELADAKATAKACAAARLDLALPRSIVAAVVPSNTMGIANLNWAPGPGADPSVTYSVLTQMLGSGGWVNWRGNGFPAYNASSFTVSGLPLFHQLKFGIFATKFVPANIPDSNGVLHSEKVKCQTDPVFSNAVVATRTAFQVGVLPPTPIPSIPAGDDIILYVHGGPGSRLEEASDLVPPLLREGLAVGKHYTIISFDQASQGYSSMIDPDILVPQHQNNVDYYPLEAFSENSIVAFVNALNKITPIENRNIYIIGGSNGGGLSLRMGHRQEPWIKKIVAWNPTSVWTTYSHDALKGIALNTGFGRATATDDPGRREEYFNFVFGMPTPETQPNPEEWYRGDRDQYAANRDTHPPFRAEWACKWDYIGQARMEHQEIYNPAGRQWHWRLGTEVLLFSFFNDNWVGPANTAPDKGGNPANYLNVVKPTLLVASDDDDWNMGELLGFPRHWENRWTQVNAMAPLMKNTPGSTLFVPNTGHSIHNERPNFLANQIVGFLASPAPSSGPLQVGTLFDETKMPWESCQPQLSQFPPPIPQLLDNSDSATFLMEPGQLRGRFSNNKTAGQYSLRLQGGLRDVAVAVAAAQDSTNALAHAVVSFYKGDTVFGNAFADLAVTGRTAYAAFGNQPPTANGIMAAALALKVRSSIRSAALTPVLAPPIDQAKLLQAAQAALTRAYEVAWALRNPDPMVAYWFRQTLGWVAVSGEDDSPDRPVNVSSGIPVFDQNGNQISTYPQYDLPIKMCPVSDPTKAPYEFPGQCAAANTMPVPIQIRYTIASSDSAAVVAAAPSSAPTVTFAPNTLGGISNGPRIVTLAPNGSTQSTSGPASSAPKVSASGQPTTTAPAQSLGTGVRAPVGPIVGRPLQAAPVQTAAPPAQQLPPLSVSACPTVDGRSCLRPGQPRPLINGSRIMDLVSVTSNGAPVAAATVMVPGQNIAVQTGPNGVALINHQPCVTRTVPSAAAPCGATVTKSGFQPFTLALP